MAEEDNSAPVRRGKHNLPTDLTRFVGRDLEIATVKRLWPTTRLLTLVGSAGVGKTRLALKIASDLVDEYEGGVFLVELAPLADPTLVPNTVALALSVPEQPGRPVIASLVDALRPRRAFLVLDNCEHVVQACAELVDTLLRACSDLQILATSRESLRLAGEITWRVPSLSLPPSKSKPPPDTLAGYDAIRLFVERAEAALPGFVLTNQNASTIARICARLDGIPLAIELAAVRVSVLGLSRIEARLSDRFHLLTGGSRTALPRHQTLRATLDWSIDLLADKERILFGRLAVFAGGWDLEAAEAVCSGNGIAPDEVMDLLSSLVDKSLVLVEQPSGEARYTLLEMMRAYGWELLQASGQAGTIRDRHRDWFLAMLRLAQPELYRGEQVLWFARLEREHENMRAVFTWCHVESPRPEILAELASRMWWFWYQRGHLTEGWGWLQTAVGIARDPYVRIDLLLGAGFLAYGHANLKRAHDHFAQSLELARVTGDERRLARSLAYLSFVMRDQGYLDQAWRMVEESMALYHEDDYTWDVAFVHYLQGRLALNLRDGVQARVSLGEGLLRFRGLGDRYGTVLCLRELGNAALESGDNASAVAQFEEGLGLSRVLGSLRGMCFSVQGLTTSARHRGDHAQAVVLARELLDRGRQLGNPAFIAKSLEELAALAQARSNPERAARLLGAAASLREHHNAPMTRLDHDDLDYQGLIAEISFALGATGYAAAWEAGRGISLEAAVDDALASDVIGESARADSSPDEPTTSSLALGVLSLREREVAALVARGLSNRAIAEALVIAPRTVDTHVSNILSKLDLHSRSQIAAWSVQHGLVALRHP